MKTASFHRVSAIRQQAREGCSVLSLATKYQLAITTIENILACRTREAAAAVLDTENSPDVVRRFMLVEGQLVDFTNLLQTAYK